MVGSRLQQPKAFAQVAHPVQPKAMCFSSLQGKENIEDKLKYARPIF